MRVNNAPALLTVAQWKKNDKTLAEQLKKVATGMKLVGADDGASEYAISEKMRVRIRSLGQDNDNVQTGMSLLRVASGAVQEQLDIMKTIKQKVIDANNDTNTDSDRATIQKEINQGYQQIQDIATDTTYNGRRLLFGNTVDHTIVSWSVKDRAELVDGSDSLQLIPDVYNTLDGLTGPFDIFSTNQMKYPSVSELKLSGTQKFSGASPGTPNVYTMDFSNYTTVDSLEGVGVKHLWNSYVFRKNSSYLYDCDYTVDVSKCTSVQDAMKALASVMNADNNFDRFYTAGTSGNLFTITSKGTGVAENQDYDTPVPYTAAGTPGSPGTLVAALPDAPATGRIAGGKAYLTGGIDKGKAKGDDKDAQDQPGAYASLTLDLRGISAGTGIGMYGNPAHDGSEPPTYLRFVAGSSGFQHVDWADDQKTSTWQIGLDSTATMNFQGMVLKYDRGMLTLTADMPGSYANKYYVTDGAKGHVQYIRGAKSGTQPVTGFSGAIVNTKSGTDGTHATYTLDLSNIPNTTSSDDVEAVIHALRGKILSHVDADFKMRGYYAFIDSSDARALAHTDDVTLNLTFNDTLTRQPMDLGILRNLVAGTNGTTVREALRQLMVANMTDMNPQVDGNGNVVLSSYEIGQKGNENRLDCMEYEYSSYTIDFADWFQKNAGKSIPKDLYGKGFRFYCATDSKQWFNIAFTDNSEEQALRVKSGTSSEDIKSISVDVSSVRSATDLVNAIYDQTMPILTSSDPNYNHYYRMATDSSTGTLIIYDNRQTNLRDSSRYPDMQDQGAKIADGVYDNVVKSEKGILTEDLVIQHTDQASKNIHLRIPRTTMDQLFQYDVSAHKPSDFNVLTKSMREQLLGYAKAGEGVLDRGIRYLTDAQTIIGAQYNHLEHAHDNIVTQEETTTASESVIRDADMAKEMTNYMKANILSQSAAAMTAQANKSSSNVLSLLE